MSSGQTRMRMCPVRLPRRSDGKVQARSYRTQVPLNVLIPLGGLGSNEYVEAGYRLPKPMVPIVGRPMLMWMLDNLELEEGDFVWIGIRRDVESKYSLSHLLRREYPQLKLRVVCFDFETRGATETLYCILNAMDAESRMRRTISLDSDTLWFCDVLGGARALPPDVGASFYFNDTSDDANAPYSYIRVDASTSRIVDIREKVAISRLANNGAYVFPSGDQARKGLEALLDIAVASSSSDDGTSSALTLPDVSNGQQQQPKSVEDFHHRDRLLTEEAETLSIDDSAMLVTESERARYVSGLINYMMRRSGVTFLAVLANDFANLGSPAKLQSFISRLRRGEVVGARAMRFCFGLDGTLLTPPRDPNWHIEEDDEEYTGQNGSDYKRHLAADGTKPHLTMPLSPNRRHYSEKQSRSWPSPRQQHRRGHLDTSYDLGQMSRDYSSCRPIAKNIAIARELHDAGHTIIIWTDRGMRESGGSAASAMAHIGRVTFEQLESFEIPYDEVVFGKPHADVYVDSQAVNPLLGDKFETAIGWDLADGGSGLNSDLDSGVAPRHFNSIRRVGDDYVEKTGPRSVLRGEIFWYQHVPPILGELFPVAHAVREHPAQELSSVVLDRVVGVTYSHLIVNSCITPGRLTLLLNSLNRLHRQSYVPIVPNLSSPGTATADTAVINTNFVEPNDVTDEMLLSNYRTKVHQRYTKHKTFFASFNDEKINTDAMATIILERLDAYESAKRFKRCNYIHGDPVFSNVMLTTDSKVKFLDMRGCLGDSLTTAGDLNYDLSKVYQSLCGYDFMILDVPRSPAADIVLSNLKDRVFAHWLKVQHPDINLNDIVLITAAHFFCIVPLHENNKHQRLFLQASYSLLQSLGLL